jgi:hypothetical protein
LAQQKADALIRRNAPELAIMKIENSTAPQRQQVAQHILENIWDHTDVIEGAGKLADYVLFRNRDVAKNKVGALVETGLRQIIGAKEAGLKPGASFGESASSAVIDFVIPFWNVPYNFTKRGVGLATAPVWETGQYVGALARGDRQAQGEHFAKAVKGGLVMYFGTQLALGDNLTGPGPRDPGDRRIWLQKHQPNSFRVPGYTDWVSYQGMPWAIPFAAIAGAKEELQFKKKEQGELSPAAQYGTMALGVGKGALEGAMSNSFLDAAATNFRMLTGQGESLSELAQFGASTASRYLTPVPAGLLNFLGEVWDTVERDPGKPRTIDEILPNTADRLRMRIPGVREELPARLDAYGNERPNQRSPRVSGPAALFPTYRGPAPGEGDAITGQLERGSIGIPDAPKTLTLSSEAGTSMPLTIAEQREFQRIYGQRYRTILEKQGAGTKEMTEYRLERLRALARDQAEKAIIRSVPVEERRRRMRRDTPVRIAP